MAKPDDSSLSPDDLCTVEERARQLLNRADAWDRFPIPIDDILAAAKVQVAPTSAFDPVVLLAYIKFTKILGLYDADEHLIHIADSVVVPKQTFLKLHETGHHELPTHRKIFRFFLDCKKTLAPEIADQFEREANNFARFMLFKGETFVEHAADYAFEIKTPIKLAKKFGASLYASAREFARTNHRACVVYVLDPLEYVECAGMQAPVRRIEASFAFTTQFGQPTDTAVTPDHSLWPVLPIGRKMTWPVSLSITDTNGTPHECVAEAFDTTHNILVLLYPKKTLTTTTVILQPSARLV